MSGRVPLYRFHVQVWRHYSERTQPDEEWEVEAKHRWAACRLVEEQLGDDWPAWVKVDPVEPLPGDDLPRPRRSYGLPNDRMIIVPGGVCSHRYAVLLWRTAYPASGVWMPEYDAYVQAVSPFAAIEGFMRFCQVPAVELAIAERVDIIQMYKAYRVAICLYKDR